MRFRILGPLAIETDGGSGVEIGSQIQRAVLGLLLVNANQIVSTDRLIDEIWGDEAGKDRQNALWVHLSNLRKTLEPDRAKGENSDILVTKPPGYLLRVEDGQLDAAEFEALVAEGRALRRSDPAAASLVLSEALAMWRGHALENFTYETWAQAEIARLDELRLEAVEARLDADLDRGMARELVGELESLVRQHPLREHLAGHLMVALYRSGRQAEAMRVYQALKARLGDELGIEPSPDLQRLEEQVLMNDPALDTGAEVTLPGAGAQPGLSVRGYELRDIIGEGASGVVYRAYQPTVGREVAVKVIRPDRANDPAFIRRFEAEAQLVATLEHPHIVPLHDYWREPDAAYLVMRLLKAGNLADRLDNGGVDRTQLALVVGQVGEALVMAHRHGVVHRDIKPENILLDDDGNAYLADFGIAIGRDGRFPGDDLPETVSDRYAAPEQLNGGEPSPATDVYSLAVVIRNSGVDLDGTIAEVLDRATATDPQERYPDANSFLDALEPGLIRRREAVPIPTTDTPNPYKGLRPFEQADAADYFGREGVVERLLARLAQPGPEGRFIAVVGPSGAGKSSVVKAGLIPALRSGAIPGSETWFTAELVPAPHPFEKLADALDDVAVHPVPTMLESLTRDEHGLATTVGRILPDDNSQIVIVVDQFEELFTQVDEGMAARFLETLVVAVTDGDARIRIVVTLRADFYDRPLDHPLIGDLLRDGTEAVTPMVAEELERAITGPVESLRISYEPALVATMIGEVADRPGALPLLQYALTELFDRRTGSEIRLSVYEEIGGVAGAMVNRAEGLFSELGPDLQEAIRQLFLQLVTLGEGADTTRRRVLLTELGHLGSGESVEAVLEAYGRHRLLTFDRDPTSRAPTVEIAHEALLRTWPRLRRWIDQARHDVLVGRRLEEAAAEWNDNDRASGFLLQGGRLAQAESHLASTTVSASGLAVEFVAMSRATVDAEEAQRRQRRRRIMAGFTAAAAIAVVLAVVALIAQQQSASNAAEARSRELAAAATNTLAADPELSIMLALAATEEATPGVETTAALHNGLIRDRVVFSYTWPHTVPFGVVLGAMSPDGRVAAFTGSLDRIEVVDLETGDVMWDHVFPGGSRIEAGIPVFVAGGAEIAVATTIRPSDTDFDPPDSLGVTVFDTISGEVLRHFPGGRCGSVISRSAGGSRVLEYRIEAGSDCAGFYTDPLMRILDTTTGDVIELGETIATTPFLPTIGAVSGDGRIAAFPTGDGSIGVFDVATRTVVEDVGANPRSIALNPDGSVLMSGGADPVADAVPGEPGDRVVFRGHGGRPFLDAGFGATSVAYSSGEDGTIRIWRTLSGEEVVVVWSGIDNPAAIVSSSADGRLLLATAGGPRAHVYDTELPFPAEVGAHDADSETGRFGSQPSAPQDPFRISFDAKADGSSWFVSSVWFESSLQRAHPAWGPATSAVFNPDSTFVVIAWLEGIEVINLKTGEVAAARHWPLEVGLGPSQQLAFSEDGAILAGATLVVRGPGDVHILDPATLETIEVIPAVLPGNLTSMDLSADGEMLAVGDEAGRVRVWSLRDRRLLHSFDMTEAVWWLVFADEGDHHLEVTLRDGFEYTMTLDTEELLEIARSRLTRGFTDVECGNYRLDPCPTLEELQGG